VRAAVRMLSCWGAQHRPGFPCCRCALPVPHAPALAVCAVSPGQQRMAVLTGPAAALYVALSACCMAHVLVLQCI
jgi:hypothetical protein